MKVQDLIVEIFSTAVQDNDDRSEAEESEPEQVAGRALKLNIQGEADGMKMYLSCLPLHNIEQYEV